MSNSLAYNLPTCFLNLFLNKGIMSASFHSKGTIPSLSDMLNTCACGVLICSTVSFSILGDIPSTPGDLSRHHTINLYDGFVGQDDVVAVAVTSD